METIRRNSKKRHAIYEAIRNTKEHPSAELLYTRLKPEYADLSLGTIYRNLNVLMEDGLIISVGNVKGQERYDACVKPHAHFICTCCGKVEDVPENHIALPNYALIEQGLGCTVRTHALSFTGLCCDCC